MTKREINRKIMTRERGHKRQGKSVALHPRCTRILVAGTTGDMLKKHPALSLLTVAFQRTPSSRCWVPCRPETMLAPVYDSD